MKAENWPRIQEIFEAALAVPARSLKAWLADTCGSDSELRGEVEAMLEAHQRQGVLDLPLDTLISDLFSTESQDPALEHLESRFRIFRELGRGGMGIVYHAHDELLDRDIALKFLPAHLQTDADARKRLLSEARAVSALDHKSICTVHDVGETEDGSIYIVMAFYGGKTLAEILSLRTLPIEECLRIALRLAEGLQCAHDAGVIHRDVKPSNIIICDSGEIKLVDFGIAKLESRLPQTEPGARIGTISYMSPEQARGEETDHHTDMWSLGVVLYEMLTGKHPFNRENPAAILNAILHENPPPASTYRDGVTPGLEHILSRTLEKSRQDRYSTMQELASDLSESLQSGSTTSIIQQRISAHRIPSPLTPFIGRERELRDLKELLSQARLVTLTGPAGTGKTRLSLKVAQEIGRRFEGGAYFVPLAPIHDPNLVVTTIAQSLGLGDIAGEAPLARLKRSLAGTHKFIVLDNFEQVVSAAPVIADLLEHCPELKIMVTSRIALRIRGEYEFPVPPLELPTTSRLSEPTQLAECAAIKLFVERARAVNPTFQLARENSALVSQICQKLDGLPLAIELAATRVKLLSLQSILSRLGRRLDLLKGGGRDQPDRHQTLRQAIGWSYDLLTPDEQAFFRRVSIFLGSFTLEAASEVCCSREGQLDVIDAVSSLIDHNLLRRQDSFGDEERFAMLATIRAYALEHLEQSGEDGEIKRRHALYFLKRAEQAAPELTGSRQNLWLHEIEADHDNLRLALRWFEGQGEIQSALRVASSIWRFWLSRGHLEEGRSWFERLLVRQDRDGSKVVRARSLHGLGTLVNNEGDNRKARKVLEEALEIWRNLDDPHGLAAELNNLAWIAIEMAEFDTARDLSSEGLNLSRKLDDRRGIAVALNNLGWISNYQADCSAALKFHEDSLAYRRDIKDHRGIAFALSNISWAERDMGRFAGARAHVTEALRLLHQLDDRLLTAWALTNSGALELHEGNLKQACELLQDAIDRWQEMGNNNGRPWSLILLAQSLEGLGRLEEASSRAQEGLQGWQAFDNAWGIALARAVWGKICLRRGELELAREYFQSSLTARKTLRDRRGISECLEGLATIMARTGSTEHALLLIQAAEHLRWQIQIPLPPLYKNAVNRLKETLCQQSGKKGQTTQFDPENCRSVSIEDAMRIALQSAT